VYDVLAVTALVVRTGTRCAHDFFVGVVDRNAVIARSLRHRPDRAFFHRHRNHVIVEVPAARGSGRHVLDKITKRLEAEMFHGNTKLGKTCLRRLSPANFQTQRHKDSFGNAVYD
jgi:hypothetical protein